MKKIILAFVLTLISSALFAGNSALSSYLLTDSYPEAAAKGASSGTATYSIQNLSINPAAISSIENFAYIAMHSAMAQDMSLEKISAAKYFDFGCMGLSLAYLNMGTVSVTGIDENMIPVFTGDIKNPYSVYGSLSYAKKFEGFSLGAAIKMIDENLAGSGVVSFAADAGFISEGVIWDDMSLGMSVLNMSKKEGDFSLPLDINAAVSYNVKNRMRDIIKITAFTDYLVYEQSFRAGAGVDYALFDEFVLRGGFTAGNKEDINFTAGFTFKAGGTSFSYAYVPQGTAGNTNKFSISASFGREQENVEKPETKGGESFEGYMKSGNYYYENRQYRMSIKYYEYINLIYWKDIEDLKDREKSAFFQKLGICYYNIKDNRHALQYFDRAQYYDRDNEILKHWIRALK
jgi:hypothetical protein